MEIGQLQIGTTFLSPTFMDLSNCIKRTSLAMKTTLNLCRLKARWLPKEIEEKVINLVKEIKSAGAAVPNLFSSVCKTKSNYSKSAYLIWVCSGDWFYFLPYQSIKCVIDTFDIHHDLIINLDQMPVSSIYNGQKKI